MAAATWPPPLATPRLLRQADAAGKSILHIERPGAQSKPVPDEIKAILDKLEAASGNALPRAQSVIAALKAALDQTAPSKLVDTLKSAQPHQLQLSLLAAAMTSEAPPARPMSAIDATDFYQYGNFIRDGSGRSSICWNRGRCRSPPISRATSARSCGSATR